MLPGARGGGRCRRRGRRAHRGHALPGHQVRRRRARLDRRSTSAGGGPTSPSRRRRDRGSADLALDDVGWLRERPASRSWSRACSAATTPCAASTRERRRSTCPTTAVASSTGASAPPSALGEVVAAVGDRAEVYVDGGIRTRRRRAGRRWPWVLGRCSWAGRRSMPWPSTAPRGVERLLTELAAELARGAGAGRLCDARRGAAILVARRPQPLTCGRCCGPVARDPDLRRVRGRPYCSLLSPGSGGKQDRAEVGLPAPGGHPALNEALHRVELLRV